MASDGAAGSELLEHIAATLPAEDGIVMWWLGQSGYLLRWRDLTVLIDPYLSDHLATKYAGTDKPHDRLTPAPFAAEQITNVDLILATHQHSDHLDPGSIKALLEASPDALLVLPAAIADYAADELGVGDERMVPIRDGEMFEKDGLRVHAIPAAHEQLDVDDAGQHLYLSYVVDVSPVRIVFAGDTIPWLGQSDRFAAFEPQVACLPINGRDARRQALGTPGNLTIAEAARLAVEVGVEIVVPNHYGMFAFNTAEPADFQAHCEQHFPDLQVEPLEPGLAWRYPLEAH